MNNGVHADSGVWLTWTTSSQAADLERRLVEYLEPEANQYPLGEGGWT